jgi:hypothetical protein
VWDDVTKRWQPSPAAQANAAQRAAACVRIAALVDSQHEHVRGAVLGDMGAVERLREIDGEISEL